MHSHFNSILLDLKELTIFQVEKTDEDFFIHVKPTAYTQPCPACHSNQVIRRGVAYQRKVCHLPTFGRRVFLILPAIRMTCTHCEASFVWQYECVAPGKRYTRSFEASLPNQVVGNRDSCS
ncbi:MAG: transposase family protein [Bacillota bacterium]